jgi:hypothetical protein
MPLPTCQVTVRCYAQNGQPDPGARVTARLNRAEVYQGYIVPEEIEAIADATGVAVLTLFRNALGSTGSMYKFRIEGTEGAIVKVLAAVPDVAAAFLEDIALLPAYPGKPDGARAIEIAQAALTQVVAAAAAAAQGIKWAFFDTTVTGATCLLPTPVLSVLMVFFDGRVVQPENYHMAGTTVMLDVSLIGVKEIAIGYTEVT